VTLPEAEEIIEDEVIASEKRSEEALTHLTKQTRNSKLTKTEQSEPMLPDPIPIKEI
jgi:hypothetical protein